MSTISYREIPAYVASRTPFQGNSLSARIVEGDLWYTGILPAVEEEKLQAQLREYGRLYVVYSYKTPIAWGPTLYGELYVPDVKYSATTSRGQALVRRASR